MPRREWESCLVGVVLLAGCKGTEPPAVPATLSVTVSDPDIDVGESVQAAAVGRTSSGAQVNVQGLRWSTSDSLVARVSSTGSISAEGRGSAVITASSGTVQGSLQLNVVDRAHSLAFVSAPFPTSLVGDSAVMRVVVRDSALAIMGTRPTRWVSRDESIATVSPAGMLQGKAKGAVWVEARSGAVRDSQLVVVIARRSGPNRDVAYRHFPAASPNAEEVWVWAGPGKFSSERASQRGRPVRSYRWSQDGAWLLVAYRQTPTEPASVEMIDPSLGNRLSYALPGAHSIDLSPDKSTFAVSMTSGGRQVIATLSPDGTSLRPLTEGAGAAISPQWAPDGRQIAFLRVSDVNQVIGELWIMRPDGSAPMRLAPVARNVAWSPDAQRLAFDDGDRVWTVRRDGANLTVVSPPSNPDLATENGRPRWSSDARSLVYTWSGEVHILMANGAVLVLVRGDPSVKHPDFSPDGQFISWASATGLLVGASAGGGQRTGVSMNNVEPFPLWRP